MTQSFFIADMGERKAEAAALLLTGGGGNISLRVEDGQIKFGHGQFPAALARASSCATASCR